MGVLTFVLLAVVFTVYTQLRHALRDAKEEAARFAANILVRIQNLVPAAQAAAAALDEELGEGRNGGAPRAERGRRRR